MPSVSSFSWDSIWCPGLKGVRTSWADRWYFDSFGVGDEEGRETDIRALSENGLARKWQLFRPRDVQALMERDVSLIATAGPGIWCHTTDSFHFYKRTFLSPLGLSFLSGPVSGDRSRSKPAAKVYISYDSLQIDVIWDCNWSHLISQLNLPQLSRNLITHSIPAEIFLRVGNHRHGNW